MLFVDNIKNDFNDTTRADVTEIPQAPVGWKISDNQSIHGYNAETKTIDPNDDNDLDAVGKDSNVVIEKENQKAVIRYVSTNGNRVLTTDEVTGKSGEAIAYSTTSQITESRNKVISLSAMNSQQVVRRFMTTIQHVTKSIL